MLSVSAYAVQDQVIRSENHSADSTKNVQQVIKGNYLCII